MRAFVPAECPRELKATTVQDQRRDFNPPRLDGFISRRLIIRGSQIRLGRDGTLYERLVLIRLH